MAEEDVCYGIETKARCLPGTCTACDHDRKEEKSHTVTDDNGAQHKIPGPAQFVVGRVNHVLYDPPVTVAFKATPGPRYDVASGRVMAEPGYERLAWILDEALEQAQGGKGKERHATGEPFHEQPGVQTGLLQGSSDGAIFQAIKKLLESKRLPPERRRAERLGAINYVAIATLIDEKLDARKKE